MVPKDGHWDKKIRILIEVNQKVTPLNTKFLINLLCQRNFILKKKSGVWVKTKIIIKAVQLIDLCTALYYYLPTEWSKETHSVCSGCILFLPNVLL